MNTLVASAKEHPLCINCSSSKASGLKKSLIVLEAPGSD